MLNERMRTVSNGGDGSTITSSSSNRGRPRSNRRCPSQVERMGSIYREAMREENAARPLSMVQTQNPKM